MAVVVAIDGPSGSGKSTISRQVAASLGLGYLDTGAMYRAAAWWCDQHGKVDDAPQVVADFVAQMPLQMVTNPHNPGVVVDDKNIDAEIRSTHISTIVSKIATNLQVRALMKKWQREIIGAHISEPDAANAKLTPGEETFGGIVAEGRDLTTVIVPDADVRILLTASEEARLRRRAKDVHGQASAQAIEATRDQVVRRDRDDSTVSNFTTAADGVIEIDTSDLTIEESVNAVYQLVKEKL